MSGPDRASSVPDLHKNEAAREACAVSHDGLVVKLADQVIRPRRTADAERPWEGTPREAAMVGRLIQTAKSAYQFPLIFKQLWNTPRVQAPDQEIVYRDLRRFTYRQIRERIGRLATALNKAGVEPGDTVAISEKVVATQP